MKLTRKLSLWIGLGICAVLALHAWLRVRSDVSEYRSDVLRDHDVTGRSLATAVELLWRTDGEARAREVIEELNLRTAHAQIRWVWPGADPADEEAPMRADLVPRPDGPTRSEVIEDADGPTHILSYAHVDLPGPRDGAIEILESLEGEHAHVRSTVIRAAATTSVLVALCVALTLGFGMVFVARPLRLLADKARRIGDGDLEGPVEIAQDDEIRDVGRAMNEMCGRLSEARERIARESAAKMRALEQLRHADRLRTVGQLASMMAHELGTPLNVVRARGSMIAEGEISIERARELGLVVIEQSDRMAAIIRRLLDFARRDPPDRYRTDLGHAVRQAVRMLEPIARKRDVQLAIEVAGAATSAGAGAGAGAERAASSGAERSAAPGSEIDAWIDPRQIQQAVTNLVVNAIHASPPGATVSIAVRPAPERPAEEAWVDVLDRGPGIAADQLEQLFEPFVTTKSAGEGTGLGLPIADEIVREHGGAIEVESTPGEGARFRIRLPRREGEPEVHAASDASQVATSSHDASIRSHAGARSAARESWRQDSGPRDRR